MTPGRRVHAIIDRQKEIENEEDAAAGRFAYDARSLG